VEEACNGGDLTILDELAPRSGSLRAGAWPAAMHLRQLLLAFRGAAPDAHWQIVEQIAERNTVVTRLSVRGTFSGPLIGLAPPGRPATLSGVAISRFARGRLVELWLQADLLGFLQQLGVLPQLGLTQVVTMTQVLHAGALLADGHAPSSSPSASGQSRSSL
jgi:predicted ester cyclase